MPWQRCPTATTWRSSTPTPPLLPRAENARASWNFLRPRDDRDGVTVTYDLTRLQRLPTDTHYLVTLGGEDLVDPASVIARREYAHPLYTPASVAAQRALPAANTARIAFAGAYHGWGFHEDGARSGAAAAAHLGLPWDAPEVPAPGMYSSTIRHTRRRPFAKSYNHHADTWLVDLDALPDHGRLGTFEARDHLGSPDASIRANVDAFLAGHGIDLRGGRVLMAANARALGYCFNPISVFWCFDAEQALAAAIVEVHNTYGGRHAYLVHPDERGRARVDKSLYVSPFHGTDGWYDVRVPVPGDDLFISVTLHTDDGATFSASLAGRRTDGLGPAGRARGAPGRRPDPRPRRRALAAPPADPTADRRRHLRPHHPSPSRHLQPRGDAAMTTSLRRPAIDQWPDLGVVPTGLRTTVSAAVARRLFEAGLAPDAGERAPRGPRPGPGRTGDDDPPARGVLRPARPGAADRVR